VTLKGRRATGSSSEGPDRLAAQVYTPIAMHKAQQAVHQSRVFNRRANGNSALLRVRGRKHTRAFVLTLSRMETSPLNAGLVAGRGVSLVPPGFAGPFRCSLVIETLSAPLLFVHLFQQRYPNRRRSRFLPSLRPELAVEPFERREEKLRGPLGVLTR